MVLIGATVGLLLATAPASPQQEPAAGRDQVPIARRVATTALLAAQEYRAGVRDGRVIAQAEVDEARLFLAEARRSALLLPPDPGHRATAEIDTLIRLVDGTVPPDTLGARARHLAAMLAERLGVTLDEIPDQAPSLARGAKVYQENCASCHGTVGHGDGPMAARLDPRPASLADAAALRDISPLDFYRRISIGVAGTAMPAFEGRLSSEDRWAAAAYATLLRLPRPSDGVPPALRAFSTTAKMSDAEVLAALGTAEDADTSLAHLAAVRSLGPASDAAASAEVFARVRGQLDSAYALGRAGQGAAASAMAFDAYMTFEQVEPSVRSRSPALAAALEETFAALRTRTAGGATPAELEGIRRQLAAGLENAERMIGETLSPPNLFFQSFVILVREGLEAILVIGALLTFLTKTGAGHRRRDIHIGVGAAVAASLLTALALETVFRLTPAKREALEGLTMVAATVVLFYVSYWLLSKMEVAKWNRFVRSKVQDAVSSGSALALASAAFLAVYREGFETVLFYKALFVAGGSGGSAAAILGGIGLGAIVMAAIYVAMTRFGVRLPLKPFFAVTSAFLYYMAFVFAGKGVAELQEGGIVSTTVVGWAPRIPALGIYPTVESLAAQAVLLGLLLVALVWTFVLAPRRARTPSPAAADRAAPQAASTPTGAGTAVELLRSLERMEADLAEMRAEVERMRANLRVAQRRSDALRRGP